MEIRVKNKHIIAMNYPCNFSYNLFFNQIIIHDNSCVPSVASEQSSSAWVIRGNSCFK